MPPADPPDETDVTPASAAAVTVVYTDGACRGNPGPGGWAWAVPGGAWASGYDPATTNQRMEITAAWRAVEAIEGPVHVVSDSTYVVNCFRDEWWRGWQARGWRNSKKEPVANRDLWEPFVDLVVTRGDVTFGWVKGHGGDPMNDLVDRLAVAASRSERGGSGEHPPDPDQLGEPDAPRSSRGSASAGVGSARERDSRVPAGTPYVVVGLRSPELAASPRGEVVRRQLAAVLAAQATLAPDLVVLTGGRPGAEELAVRAAQDAGVPYAMVLPYPDPAAGWPEAERAAFAGLCDAAREVVTVERKRPTDGAGRRAAMSRRDGWLRSIASGAVVVTDGRDAEAELLLRRFTESLGDDVWPLEVEPV